MALHNASLPPTRARRTAAPRLPALLPTTCAVLAFMAGTAWAQQPSASAPQVATPASAAPATATLGTVTVTDRSAPVPADITGFGDLPAREVPLSTTVVNRQQLDSIGARRLSDLTRLDPSTSDSYNSAGYWDFLTVRGYVLDNRTNYRRDGLPISGETSIALDNKERIEILKGTSGVQAGVSSPGGLVNYVVKRPGARDIRTAHVELSERGSLLLAADLGSRAGAQGQFGWRLNAAHETLRPHLRSASGDRQLIALAADWRASRDTLVDAEVEWSQRSQPSQPAFSLLGNTLPRPDPRVNLNNQPWSTPVAFHGVTGSVRMEQALNPRWRWSAQLGTQRLRTDDRLAFPYGCSAEGNFDRYCSNGTYDMYDYRSDGERRHTLAARATLHGQLQTGPVRHDLGMGVLRSRLRETYNMQAFNYVGTGDVTGSLVTPADPTLTGDNTNRLDRSTELHLQDAMSLGPWRAWLGLRHTRLERDSIRTNGAQATSYSQHFNTPWLALSYTQGGVTAYASTGQGVETRVVPNLPGYGAAAGTPLPALKSRQWELGLRGETPALAWSVAWFDIRRPAVADTGATLQFDGDARHRGMEAQGAARLGAWRVEAGAMFIDARRRGSAVTPNVNGLRPVNVPENALRLGATYHVAALPGLSVDGRITREGERAVLADNTIMLPAWTRLDAGLSYKSTIAGAQATWRLAVDNLTDRRYWRESPTQFGHIYLYPGAPRTLRASVQASF